MERCQGRTSSALVGLIFRALDVPQLPIKTGSEAMEAALKLARQHFLESNPPQPRRTRFIARHESYHGTTLGALSVSGHKARRAPYEPMLLPNMSRVSACNAYRGMIEGETEAGYVDRLAKELDEEFWRLGPENVCAFVAEPIVGAVSTLSQSCLASTDHNPWRL